MELFDQAPVQSFYQADQYVEALIREQERHRIKIPVVKTKPDPDPITWVPTTVMNSVSEYGLMQDQIQCIVVDSRSFNNVLPSQVCSDSKPDSPDHFPKVAHMHSMIKHKVLN